PEFEPGIERGVLSHGYRDRVVLKGPEISATIYYQLVLTGRQSNEVVVAVVIGHGGALGGSDRVCYCDFRAFDGKSLRIAHRSGQRWGIYLCRSADRGA